MSTFSSVRGETQQPTDARSASLGHLPEADNLGREWAIATLTP